MPVNLRQGTSYRGKASAILIRGDERFNHFSVYKVAIELTELRQPEFVTLEVDVASRDRRRQSRPVFGI